VDAVNDRPDSRDIDALGDADALDRIGELEAERVALSRTVTELEAELAACRAAVQPRDEALGRIDTDARWIVGQWQRLQDEPVKQVALAIVEACALASSTVEAASEPQCVGCTAVDPASPISRRDCPLHGVEPPSTERPGT